MIDELLYLNEEGMSTTDLQREIDLRLKMKGFVSKKKDGFVVSKRQIEYDLREMKDAFDAPISLTRGQRRVRYTNMTYCAFKDTYDSVERRKDSEASISPESKGRIKWLKLWINHLQDARVSEIVAEAVEFDDNLSLNNLEMLPMLLNAIVKKQVLFISYNKDFGAPDYYTVSPYFLKQYSQRWYLFAYNKSKRRIQSFPVDRIRSIDIDESDKYKETNLNKLRKFKHDYFDGIVGITNKPNEPVIDLCLSFKKATQDQGWDDVVNRFYNLLKTNPFIGNFEFYSTENEDLAMAKKIKINRELENKLIVYAHTARINDERLRTIIINSSFASE